MKQAIIGANSTSLLQRFIEPDEIAAMVAFLASPVAAATNGAAVRVDGGVLTTVVGAGLWAAGRVLLRPMAPASEASKGRPVVRVTVLALAVALNLSACEYAEYDDPVRPPAEALADTEPFLEEMLAEDLGYDSPIRVQRAREDSCLDPIHGHDMSRVTAVQAYAVGYYPDAASSLQALETMEGFVKSKGWARTRKDDTAIVYEKGELTFSADYEYAEPSAGSPYHEVRLNVRTNCFKHPEGHVMVRSKYDPDYGISSQYYDVEAEKEDPADLTQRRLATPYGEEVRHR